MSVPSTEISIEGLPLRCLSLLWYVEEITLEISIFKLRAFFCYYMLVTNSMNGKMWKILMQKCV